MFCVTFFPLEPTLQVFKTFKHSLQEYLSNIEKQFAWKDLSFFELNLETWRQLWRVLEMSDIILFIVDIRFAVSFKR